METRNEEQPLKIRSARAVIAAGFRLYMGNFRRIFRTTWLPALIGALFTALEYYSSIQAIPQLGNLAQAPMTENIMYYLVQSFISLLSFIVTIVFLSYGFSMLSRHRAEGAIPYPARWLTAPEGRSLMRTAATAIVWIVAIGIAAIPPTVVAAIGLGAKSMTTVGAGMLIALVMGAFLLPLVYPSMRYCTTRDTRLFDLLGSGYRQGLRYWGYIFAVLFVMLLIITIILGITMLPAIVLFIANMKAQTGAMMGDPLSMPSYMGWMSFVVFTLSGFIQFYVLMAVLFPAYYMAGSIEQQEIQRNEKTKNTLY